jgi:hypothetical protein
MLLAHSINISRFLFFGYIPKFVESTFWSNIRFSSTILKLQNKNEWRNETKYKETKKE